MKTKIIFSICIISFLGFISCESNIDDNYWKNASEIIGTWKGSSEDNSYYDESMIITFHKNGTATGTFYSKSSNFTGISESFEWNSYIYDPEKRLLYYSYFKENNDGYNNDKYYDRTWCTISGNLMNIDDLSGYRIYKFTRVIE